jgi:hypothetical protein
LKVNNFKLEDDTHFDVISDLICVSNIFKNEMKRNNNNTNMNAELGI